MIEGHSARAFPPRCRAGLPVRRAAATARSASRSKPTTIPTAISPFPGAATGAGGEIRDEGATGRGGRPKAGLTGFSVSHLRIPGLPQAWEGERALNPRMASALEIMTDGPLGRRRVQQRIRPPEPDRLFPQLRTAGRARRPARAPTTSRSCWPAASARSTEPGGEAAAAARRRRDRARRPGHADRPGRRRRVFGGLRAAARKTSISPRCSATTRRWNAAARK